LTDRLSGLLTSNIETGTLTQYAGNILFLYSIFTALTQLINPKTKNMKKLFITAACIATVLSSFANPVTDKNKKSKDNMDATLNAVVIATGTKVIVTALNELPNAVNVSMKDSGGNEVYEGKLTKGDITQNGIFNLEQLGEGTYSIVLRNGKDKIERKVAINTTKQLTIE
jgi:hypothetical protein